jgi:hypothetical protein
MPAGRPTSSTIRFEEDPVPEAHAVGDGLLSTCDPGLSTENGDLRQDGGALREIPGVVMTAEAPPAT